MRILFIVPYVPSLVRTRPYNLIRYLHRRGHNISLACLGDDRDQTDLEALKPYVAQVQVCSLPAWQSYLNCVFAIPSARPFQAAYTWQPQLARQISSLLTDPSGESFDIVHVEHLRGVRYGLHVQLQPSAPPVLWDSVDSITHLFRQSARSHPRALYRSLLRLELARTEAYERRMAHQFAQVLVTSQVDREVYTQLAPRAPVQVLPNGVDLDYFQPAQADSSNPNAVVISGKMSYHPNVAMVLYFVREILPLIWAQRPQTILWVVGQNPSESILNACQDERITVTGRVADLRPYLQNAAVAAAPITYGAGIQNKVLEALACGTPVVASPLAVSALAIQPEQEILVGDQAAAFAQQVLRLLNDAELRRKVGAAGREFVHRQHSWDAVTAQLETIYRQMMNNKPSN